MQLTSCFFSTCLPSVGRNWKSCLAKERECNLDYADRRIRAHERAVPPASHASFLFPSPFLTIVPSLSSPISKNGEGVAEDGGRGKKMSKYRGGWTQDGVKRKKEKTANKKGETGDKKGVDRYGEGEQSECVYVCVITVRDSCLNPRGDNSWDSTTNTHS